MEQKTNISIEPPKSVRFVSGDSTQEEGNI
jgi:hypothetical protein